MTNEAVALPPGRMHLRPTESHRASQPGLTTPAVGASFEAEQILLQRAGEQLKIPDQERERSKDVVAAMVDQFLLDSCQKFYNYKLTIDEKMRKGVESMDSRWLARAVFKLSLTPQDIAVRYLTWLHASLGTEERNPLDGWLRELEKHIQDRYPDRRPRYLFRAAEQQVFIWVGLYVSSLLGWIEEFCAAVPVVEMAEASIKLGLSPPDLNRHLVERRNRLLEWANVIQIIEEEYLQASILPDAWRLGLDPAELTSVIAEILRRTAGRTATKACKPAECMERARTKVTALLETARATASITQCQHEILSLTRAQLTLINSRATWKEFSGFLFESQEARRDRRKLPQSSRSVGASGRRKYTSSNEQSGRGRLKPISTRRQP